MLLTPKREVKLEIFIIFILSIKLFYLRLGYSVAFVQKNATFFK